MEALGLEPRKRSLASWLVAPAHAPTIRCPERELNPQVPQHDRFRAYCVYQFRHPGLFRAGSESNFRGLPIYMIEIEGPF